MKDGVVGSIPTIGSKVKFSTRDQFLFVERPAYGI